MQPTLMEPEQDNAVVISGMAGLYPKARYVKDLENILYNKINPITADLRWQFKHPEVAQYSGNVPDIDKFDAQFFKVHHRLGVSMDPMARKILEQAYEAIYDAEESEEMQPTLMEPEQDNAVVISGMAGLYPKARYVKDLENILYNKINPITADLRWQFKHPEVAQYSGNVPDIDKFDAQFFKVHHRLGVSMDPMARKILEQAYEAIYDAGVNPHELNGKKVSVYVGTCFSESEKGAFYKTTLLSGFGMAGCSKTMYANRISYWLNTKGPSMSVDQACCSSTAALELAYQDISRGECEAAIVGGTSLCLHPQSSVHFSRMTKLSKSDETKSFDQNADGFVKSEAINVLFLQKAKDALRVYAKLLYVKCEFTGLLDEDTQPKYGFYRNPDNTTKFLKQFYKEAGIPPSVVRYVEAFGSAVPEADKSELEALDNVFGGSRDEPLLVGSVLSNIGYGEAASGISAITKVILGYERCNIAGNLHCDTPISDVAALREGRMKVLTDHHQFRGSYTAVNNMSVTGVNAHVLLQANNKPKNTNKYKATIPRLITLSSRQESGVTRAIDCLKSHPIDPEEVVLLHNIHKMGISGHLGRGYVILDTNKENETVSLAQKTSYFDDTRRPLWFLYSGMGSQWTGMGAELMRIPIFAGAMECCNRVLEPKGINTVDIITSPDPTTFDNILHSFVGITGIQIGLTDILLAVGLVPDNIIGHSVGELVCAYADGSLTAEETILCAYYRGLISQRTKFIQGAMAAIGLGFKEISNICPPEIVVACHNSANSSTVSGPADLVKQFVAQLSAKSIFAKEVACSNIPFHSHYIADAGPVLLSNLQKVIKNPKIRSKRWLSTSVPEDRWNEPIASYSSAEYFTNNLLSPVLFEETCKHIPSNAVVVELAPHGLLQAIVKRSLPESCTNIPLTRRGHPDIPLMVLEAIGELYMKGYNPNLKMLYPKVEFPVSTGTPLLSQMVDWAHDEKWPLFLYQTANRKMAASCKFVVSFHDDEHSYLKGHVIKNNILLPFSYMLVAVWDTLAMFLELPKKSFSIQFRDIHLYAQPVLHNQRQIRLKVSLHRGNGYFEVTEDDSKLATGYINSTMDNYLKSDGYSDSQSLHNLTSNDVYELLYERDYGYSGEFKSIYSVNDSISEGMLVWNDNWVTLIDGLLQLNVLRHRYTGVSRPSLINILTINVNKHTECVQIVDKKTTVLKAYISDVFNMTRCGGIVMENIVFHTLPASINDQIILKTLKFVPRYQTRSDISTTLQVFIQIVAENVQKKVIKIIGINNNTNCDVSDILPIMAKENNIPEVNISYQLFNRETIVQKYNGHLKSDIDIVFVKNLSRDDEELCNILHRILPARAFIINEEDMSNSSSQVKPSSLYGVVSVCENKRLYRTLELVRWRPKTLIAATMSTVRSQSDLPALINVRNSLPPQTALIINSIYPPITGLKDLVKEWRKEDKQNDIYLIMNDEKSQKNMVLDGFPNVDLAFNILRDGVWGGEYYLPTEEDQVVMTDVMLENKQIGNFDSLVWTPTPKSMTSGTSVKVYYAGLNMADVRRAAGVISSQNELNLDKTGYGMEFSGIIESGDRVMGLVRNGSVRSKVIVAQDYIWPVPSHWTLEDAATVPLAYVYAFYCLNIRTVKLIKKKYQYSVLVHGGTGALGQAVISVALAYGYKVFATVGDVNKKKFLLKLFPELQAEDIGNSRDISFSDMVFQRTNGRGVDAVFSCVRGDLKNMSLKCCGSFGVTFDTAQVKNVDEYSLGMNHLTDERSYVAVDINSVFSGNDNIEKLRALMSYGISCGFVRPLTRVTYEAHDAPRAFRLLAASKHRGRVLLKLAQSTPLLNNKFICSSEENHLVFCGSQSLGLQIADKLIARGAKRLHLHLLQVTGQLHYKLRTWTNLDVKVTVTSGELNDDAIYNLLREARKSGFLVGVYVAYTNITCSFIESLDVATRKLCPYLKYFLILTRNGSNKNAENTCLNRNKDGLSATYLDVTSLQKVNENRFENVLEAIELSLSISQTIFYAQKILSSKTSLLQQIANIAGVTINDNVPNKATLKELGVELEKSQILNTFLLDVHNISLDEAKIHELTVERIRQYEENITETEIKKAKGFQFMFTYVDPDELLATTETVSLPTLPKDSNMRDDEFDMNESYMWVVPGVEGHHERFRTLCERLKLPAFVLQPGLDYPNEDLQHLAKRYFKVLQMKMDFKKKFHLLGYETGIMVSLELAALLEEQGLTGTIFCIGDGPEEIKSYIDEEMQMYTSDEELQLGVIRHIFTLMEGGDVSELESSLSMYSSWSQRVAACVQILLSRVSHSAQYVRSLIEAAYVRIKRARQYKASFKKLRSQIVLLKAHTSNTQPSSINQYSLQPTIVYHLSTPLALATQDLRCAAIVNKYLHEDVLKIFDSRNLCDTYLLNAETFLSSI